MFKKTKVCTGLLLAFGGVMAVTSIPAAAQTVEITGSRIKRADSEGALPITTFNRADLEASGSATVAEFIRNISFSTDGQFRPQSGSSAQGFSGVSLRGLGSQRTLVLVDGRRVAKSPNVGDSADIQAARGEVGGDDDLILAAAEALEGFFAVLLTDVAVHDGGFVFAGLLDGSEQLVSLHLGAGEDHHAIEVGLLQDGEEELLTLIAGDGIHVVADGFRRGKADADLDGNGVF